MFFSDIKIGISMQFFYNILDRRLLSLIVGFYNSVDYLVKCRSYHPMILNVTIKELKCCKLKKIHEFCILVAQNR